MIPGDTLHRLAALVCHPRSVAQIVEPAIADLQHEWKAARTFGRRAHVLLEGYGTVLIAIGCVGRYWAVLSRQARAAWLPVCVLSGMTLMQVLPSWRGWLPLVAWVLLTTILNAGLKPCAADVGRPANH